MQVRPRRRVDLDRVTAAAARLELPDAVRRTSPWEPRELVVTGLRQWLRCAGAALRDGQVIGMPSHAVDEAWHGFILCTALRPLLRRGLRPVPAPPPRGRGGERTRRRVDGRPARPHRRRLVDGRRAGEECVLWDLDARVGVEQPWGVPAERVQAVLENVRRVG